MEPTDVQKLFLDRLGIRLGPEMTEYVLRQLLAGEPAPGSVAVMGGDARTGVPVRTFVDPAKVLAGEDHPDRPAADSADEPPDGVLH